MVGQPNPHAQQEKAGDEPTSAQAVAAWKLVGRQYISELGHATIASAVTYLESKQMKRIALVEPARIMKMPNVVTVNEVVPGVDLSSWLGVFAPAAKR